MKDNQVELFKEEFGIDLPEEIIKKLEKNEIGVTIDDTEKTSEPEDETEE